jgi:hypothetical protein
MTFKKRKADRRKLDAPIFSGAAEVCETRALLSADGVCLPAVDADAVVIEDIEVVGVDATVGDIEFIPEMLTCEMFPIPIIEGEVPEDLGGGDENAVVIEDIEATDSEEVVDVDATVEDGEFIPELAICTMLPVIEGEVVEDVVGGDENEVVDPSLMFYSFMPFDGGGDVDQQLIACEDYPVYKCDGAESEFGEVDITNEGVDPSLMFYSFVSSEGGDPEVAVCDGLLIEEEPVFKGEVIEEDSVIFLDHFIVVDGVEIPWRDYRGTVVDGEKVLEEEAVAEEEVVVEEGEVIEEDPVIFLDYFHVVDGVEIRWRDYRGTVVDGEKVLEEEAVVEEEVVVEEGEVIEEDPVIFLDYFHVVDGVEIRWRDYRGTVVDGEKVVDEDGEVTEEEIVHLQDGYVDVEDGGEVPVRYYYGMNFRGNTGGELHAEALSMTSGVPSTDSTPSVMGPVATSTPVATPAVNVPVVVNQPASLPVVVSPTLAIPLNNGGFTPLFVEEEELLVTSLAPVVSEIEPLVSEVEDTVLPGLDSPFGDLIGSSSDSSDASVGELTPIFGEEQDGEKPEEVPAAEDVPVETEESVGSVEAPQQPVVVASRASYGRSIDEFMSEFAMSGFAG